jgi:hypothetical protein
MCPTTVVVTKFLIICIRISERWFSHQSHERGSIEIIEIIRQNIICVEREREREPEREVPLCSTLLFDVEMEVDDNGDNDGDDGGETAGEASRTGNKRGPKEILLSSSRCVDIRNFV